MIILIITYLFMKRFTSIFIKGIVVGFAFITAISSGTVAILLGIYDEMIIAIADIRKDFKKSMSFLGPLILGVIVGAGALFYPILLFLKHAPFVATSLFVGLTLGGLITFKPEVQKKSNPFNIFLLIISIIFVVLSGVFSWFYSGSISDVSNYWLTMLVFSVIGFLASLAFVAPGISGSLFLVSIGYYEPISNLLVGIFTFSTESWWVDFSLILVFGIFVLIGIYVFSKLFKVLLTKWRTPTYFAILGWIIGSIIICYFNGGEIKDAYYQIEGFEVLNFVLSISCLIVGFLISFLLVKFVRKKEHQALQENHESNTPSSITNVDISKDGDNNELGN